MSDTIDKQINDMLDNILRADLDAEVEERETKATLNRIQQRRHSLGVESMRLRQALFALSDAVPQSGNDDRAEKENRSRRDELKRERKP